MKPLGTLCGQAASGIARGVGGSDGHQQTLALSAGLDEDGCMADGAGWPTEADYAWAEGRDAFCVSFVEATTPEAVLRKRILDGSTTGFVRVAQARRWASRQKGPDDGSVIQAGIVGGWV